MIVLYTNWSTVWLMTGLGIGTVFVILIVLFAVLSVFSKVTRKTRDKVLTGVEAVKSVVEKEEIAESTRNAAIATAVYLYMQGRHDEESGIITIHHPDHPLWHAELNEHL
ncbi:MAG: OadG family protein [Bacteroidaceae bacterium]|nr:OadG family protein [Bacteroidaceae bacterium]